MQNEEAVVYEWDFGVGASPPTASGIGPHTIQYASSGSKNVVLTAYHQSTVTTEEATITVSTCLGNITGSVKDTFGAAISGVNVRLFPDTNLDGISDGGAATRSVFTNAGGTFSMASLTPGSYVIVCVNPSGWTISTAEDITNDSDIVANVPNTDLIIPVTITPSELDQGNNFIFSANPGTITGYVFMDGDNDESPDVGEGVAGVTVELFEDNNQDGVSDGVLIDSTTTDANGFYQFTNVATNLFSGNVRHCVVVVTVPVGYTLIKDVDTSNDNDAVLNTITTNGIIPVSLTKAEVDANNNFIVAQSGKITGHVFVDTNVDNNPDLGEGVAGVTVYLQVDRNMDGVGEGAYTTVVTDAGGYYEFLDVPVYGFDGTGYILSISPPGYDILDAFDATPEAGETYPPFVASWIVVVLEPNVTDDDNYFIVELTP